LTALKNHYKNNDIVPKVTILKELQKQLFHYATRDNYTEIHEKFLNDIGTGSEHHISYSSFFLPNIARYGCSAHTIQLVIGKSLIPCQVFLARSK
ncbi:3161_t:CDS:2, partial [Entrophospora sp. SA101]